MPRFLPARAVGHDELSILRLLLLLQRYHLLLLRLVVLLSDLHRQRRRGSRGRRLVSGVCGDGTITSEHFEIDLSILDNVLTWFAMTIAAAETPMLSTPKSLLGCLRPITVVVSPAMPLALALLRLLLVT